MKNDEGLKGNNNSELYELEGYGWQILSFNTNFDKEK
ncbi:MAG: hypothetical protein CM15mP22_0480 [Gammaproteobacteria bacterium]|nr:MAG: hypothetical protein CM15mP22_0480 [Gammaproteobacteria bacterium]